MSIPNIPRVQVSSLNVGVYQIPTWQLRQPSIPDHNPITSYIGFPIINMPGCVWMHKDNKKHKNGVPIDKNLVTEDPGKAMTFCDAGMPYYQPMDYSDSECYSNCPPPFVAKKGDPPPPPPGAAEADTDNVEVDPQCPGPNQPRIGTLGPNEKEKVSGYELQRDPTNQNKKICVILYEDIGAVEQFLPSPQVAATTASIAAVAGASALLAKPLAELLTRTFKPVIKQVLTKVNKILGKKDNKVYRSEIIANEYRKKKGLGPLKK